MINPGVEDVSHRVDFTVAAFERLEERSGIDFVFEGITDEDVPDQSYLRDVTAGPRYGQRWAPIIVDWAAQMPWYAQARPVAVNGVFVSGVIEINPSYSLASFRGTDAYYSSMLLPHELGHLVGLSHVEVPGQLMSEDYDARLFQQYQPGDLEGLRRLGRGGGCLTTPPVTTPNPVFEYPSVLNGTFREAPVR